MRFVCVHRCLQTMDTGLVFVLLQLTRTPTRPSTWQNNASAFAPVPPRWLISKFSRATAVCCCNNKPPRQPFTVVQNVVFVCACVLALHAALCVYQYCICALWHTAPNAHVSHPPHERMCTRSCRSCVNKGKRTARPRRRFPCAPVRPPPQRIGVPVFSRGVRGCERMPHSARCWVGVGRGEFRYALIDLARRPHVGIYYRLMVDGWQLLMCRHENAILETLFGVAK